MNKSTNLFIFLLSTLIITNHTYAGIVINTTRIIYPEELKEKTITATNESTVPYLIQAWVEEDTKESSPTSEAASRAPFYVTPGMAKIAPGAGQALRIINKKSAELPEDRESLYIFNLVQIPPSAQQAAIPGKLNVVIKNQLKLFYRPKNIKTKYDAIYTSLKFSIQKNKTDYSIKAENPTGYYASLTSVYAISKNKRIELQAAMLAPFSEQTWVTKNNETLPSDASEIEATLINDYGGKVEIKQAL